MGMKMMVLIIVDTTTALLMFSVPAWRRQVVSARWTVSVPPAHGHNISIKNNMYATKVDAKIDRNKQDCKTHAFVRLTAHIYGTIEVKNVVSFMVFEMSRQCAACLDMCNLFCTHVQLV